MAKTTIRETKIALTMMLTLTAVDWRLNQDANPGQKNTNFSQGRVNDLTLEYIINFFPVHFWNGQTGYCLNSVIRNFIHYVAECIIGKDEANLTF